MLGMWYKSVNFGQVFAKLYKDGISAMEIEWADLGTPNPEPQAQNPTLKPHTHPKPETLDNKP